MKRLILVFFLFSGLMAKSQCDTLTSATFTNITTNSVNVSFFVSGGNWSSFNVSLYDSATGAVAFNIPSLTTIFFTAAGLTPNKTYILRVFTNLALGGGCEPNGTLPKFRTLGNALNYTPMLANGYSFKRISVDSTFHLPLQDTSLNRGLLRAGAVVQRTQDSSLYVWNGLKWDGYAKKEYVRDVVSDSIGSYKIATLYQIGDIYNKNTFTSLADFNTNTGYTVASGKINATGNNSYTSYLQLNKASALDKYTVKASYKYTTSVPATDSGFRVGMNGINGTSCYVYVKPSTRKIYGYMSYGPTYYVSDSAFSNLSVGDSISIQLEWSRGIPTMTATNFTIGQTISQTLPSTWLSSPSVISGVISNTAYPTILAGAATYQVCSFRYLSEEFSQPVLAVAGNSITRGSYASSELNRYASQIGGLVWAGPGDGTSQMILRLPELRDYVKPSILFLMIGGNDVANSVDTNTIKTNYTRIVDSATSYGIQVYHLLPTPRTASNVSWLKDYLIRVYPTKYIDTWTPILGSGTAMAAWFNSGDGVHPNAAGHTAIANRIKADTIYQRLVNQYGYNDVLDFYKITPKSVTDTTPLATKTYVDLKLNTYVPNGLNGTVNVLPKYSGNGLTASTITDNGTFINMQTNYLSLGSKLILSYGATTGGLSVNFNNNMRGDVAYNFGYNGAKVRFDSTGHGYYSGNVYAVGGVYTGNVTAATLNANTLGLGITTPLDIFHAYKSSTSQVFGIVENPSSSGSLASSGIKFRVHTGASSNDVGYIYSTGSSWSYDQSGANVMMFAGIGAGGTAVSSSNNINFFTGAAGATNANRQMRIFTNGNILAQTGGTYTDNGAKLQVTGTGRFSSRFFGTSLVLNKDSLPFATAASKITLIDTVTGLATKANIGTGLSLSGGTLSATTSVFGGSISATVTAITTFIPTIPTQANNTYQVVITPSNALTAVNYYVTNKTTTSFDVVFTSPLTGTVAFDWVLKP